MNSYSPISAGEVDESSSLYTALSWGEVPVREMTLMSSIDVAKKLSRRNTNIRDLHARKDSILYSPKFHFGSPSERFHTVFFLSASVC